MVSMPVAQSSLDHSTTGGGGTGRPTYATVSSSQPSSGASGAGPIITTTTNMSGTGGTGAGGGDAASDGGKIVADPLEKLFEDKQIRKKREALEKELKALRKAHDKEKLKIQAATAKGGELAGGEGPVKKSKFGMGNKLVKRFSSKNMADMNVKVPPCASSDTDGTGDVHSERLRQICREHATSYREVLEKYHEIIYGLAEELLRQLQDGQMKQLKVKAKADSRADILIPC